MRIASIAPSRIPAYLRSHAVRCSMASWSSVTSAIVPSIRAGRPDASISSAPRPWTQRCSPLSARITRYCRSKAVPAPSTSSVRYATIAARSAGAISETQPSIDRSNVAPIPRIASRPGELTHRPDAMSSEYEPMRATRSTSSRPIAASGALPMRAFGTIEITPDGPRLR